MSQSALNAVLQRVRVLLSSPGPFWDEIRRSPEWADLSSAEQAALRELPLDNLATFVAAGSQRRENASRSLNVA
jgi:hypothetical protein